MSSWVALHFIFWDRPLSKPRSHQIWSANPRNSSISSLCPLSWGYRHHSNWLFIQVLGDKLRYLCLLISHFTHWAFFTAQAFEFHTGLLDSPSPPHPPACQVWLHSSYFRKEENTRIESVPQHTFSKSLPWFRTKATGRSASGSQIQRKEAGLSWSLLLIIWWCVGQGQWLSQEEMVMLISHKDEENGLL